jgi:hypothetical protein
VKTLKQYIKDEKNLEEFEEDLLAKEESADKSDIKEMEEEENK